jgi:NADH-quinone oxidoreductase subunit J
MNNMMNIEITSTLLTSLTFYSFATILVFGAIGVITAKNPVSSVLMLILAFFNAAGLFVLLGAEFIAMILVIVYVGAVAVLFLFVVMMLDVDFKSLRKGSMKYVPMGLLLGGILLAELFLLLKARFGFEAFEAAETVPTVSNTEAIGMVLYTDYILAFQVAGLILLVAMMGAIVLTHRTRPGVRRQKVDNQIATKQSDAMEIVQVETGKGI